MQVRIPTPKEIKQKIIDHPTEAYFAFLGVVFVASYAVARTLASSATEALLPANDETYTHLRNGDHMLLDFNGEEFHYAPFYHTEES